MRFPLSYLGNVGKYCGWSFRGNFLEDYEKNVWGNSVEFFRQSRSGVGKTWSSHQICSRSTAFSVRDNDLGFFASCRYYPNLACTANPGPVICQGWPGEPVKIFPCSWFIPPLEVLQYPNILQSNKHLVVGPARG
jgi:hypothetical protein